MFSPGPLFLLYKPSDFFTNLPDCLLCSTEDLPAWFHCVNCHLSTLLDCWPTLSASALWFCELFPLVLRLVTVLENWDLGFCLWPVSFGTCWFSGDFGPVALIPFYDSDVVIVICGFGLLMRTLYHIWITGFGRVILNLGLWFQILDNLFSLDSFCVMSSKFLVLAARYYIMY